MLFLGQPEVVAVLVVTSEADAKVVRMLCHSDGFMYFTTLDDGIVVTLF